MKKVLCKSLTIVSLIIVCVSLFISGDSQTFSVANASEQTAGTFFVSNFENDNKKVKSFTPMGANGERMSGSSWAPSLKDGGHGVDVLNDKINISEFFESFDVKNVSQDNLCLDVWLYFDLHTMSDLTIGFENEDGSKVVEWHIDELDLYNLLKKDFSNYKYDIMFYSESSVPWGWNLLSLPFSAATQIDNGLIVDGVDEGQKVLDLTNFYVYQDTDSVLSLELNVYTMKLAESALENITCSEKQAFCVVEFNDFINSNEIVYTGEYYTLPSITTVFKSIWIGDANIMSQNFRNEQYFKIEVSSNGTVSDEYYGKAILLENPEYDITFLVGRGNGNYVALKRQTIKPQSYGSGVWFVDDEATINIDEIYELKYYIHPVFTNAVISFESSDEEVLEILEIDTIKKIVKVKGLKKGEAGITIKIYDDRLINSDNEDGLENTNLVVKIEKTKDSVTTVKVMLWIALGVVLAFGIYYLVMAIKKSKVLEVK